MSSDESSVSELPLEEPAPIPVKATIYVGARAELLEHVRFLRGKLPGPYIVKLLAAVDKILLEDRQKIVSRIRLAVAALPAIPVEDRPTLEDALESLAERVESGAASE